MKLLAITGLLLTVASAPVIGAAALTLFLFIPLFLLGLVGVLAGLEDRHVQQRSPSLDPTRWRDGS